MKAKYDDGVVRIWGWWRFTLTRCTWTVDWGIEWNGGAPNIHLGLLTLVVSFRKEEA